MSDKPAAHPLDPADALPTLHRDHALPRASHLDPEFAERLLKKRGRIRIVCPVCGESLDHESWREECSGVDPSAFVNTLEFGGFPKDIIRTVNDEKENEDGD